MSNIACVAPTLERVKKSADIDMPIVDTKRRRNAFRLVGPVEKMWRDGKIRDEQLSAFRRFERDVAITSPSKTLLARISGTAGGGSVGTEDMLDLRSEAFRHIAEIEARLSTRAVDSLRAMVLNDMTLESIGREVLMIGNKAQAIARAEETVLQGTWALALYYGMVTPPDNAAPRPG